MFCMREQRSGRIMTNSSVVVWRGAIRGFVYYAAAKAGQVRLTRTLARTAAPFGITVNAIAPGMIETDMFCESHGEAGIRAIAADSTRDGNPGRYRSDGCLSCEQRGEAHHRSGVRYQRRRVFPVSSTEISPAPLLPLVNPTHQMPGLNN